MEGVFPHLVKSTKVPGDPKFKTVRDEELGIDHEVIDDPGSTSEIKAIDYMGLIPVLTKVIQVQQDQIDDLTKRLEKLEKK